MNNLWNKRQASEFLNISPFSIAGKIQRREIAYIKLGRRILFDPADLAAFVEARKCKVEPRPRQAQEDR